MICLRCGYCCKNLSVAIIKDPSKSFNENNITFHEGNNKSCPHLAGNKPGKYSCKIHHFPWYKKTPCYAHSQFEFENSNCRIGEYILSNKNKFFR